MSNRWHEMIEQITDEKSFVRFLTALREDCENSEHDCERRYQHCLEEEHWMSRSTKNYLRSMEEWAHGDFVEGQHGGDPILRRVATMLYVGRHLRNEEIPR